MQDINFYHKKFNNDFMGMTTAGAVRQLCKELTLGHIDDKRQVVSGLRVIEKIANEEMKDELTDSHAKLKKEYSDLVNENKSLAAQVHDLTDRIKNYRMPRKSEGGNVPEAIPTDSYDRMKQENANLRRSMTMLKKNRGKK